MPTKIEWHEITLENRPPEGLHVLWCQYHRVYGTWSLTQIHFGPRRGDTIYGRAAAPSLPSRGWTDDARANCRFFWAEVPSPHELGLVEPLWEPDEDDHPAA